MTLLTNPQTREAFDLSKEDARSATVTGAIAGASNSCWRAGWSKPASEIITSSLSGPLCGRVRTGTITR